MWKEPLWMNRMQKWLVALPIVAAIVSVLCLYYPFADANTDLCEWLVFAVDTLATLISIYAWWRMMLSAKAKEYNVHKFLAALVYLSIALLVAGIIGLFVDMDFEVLFSTTGGSVVGVLIIVIMLSVIVLLINIPSRMKSYGYPALRKLFLEYLITIEIVGLICGIFLGSEDIIGDSLVGFFYCYFAYLFFRHRNDLVAQV